MCSRARLATLLVSAALLFVTGGPVPTADADPAGGASGRSWTADYRSTPRYPKVAVQRDVAIRMSDAVVLKADIYRPADRRGHPIDTKTPTLVNLTPYTKLISALGGVAAGDPILWPAVEKFVDSVNLSGTPIAGAQQFLGVVKGGAIRALGADYRLVRDGYTQIVVDVRGTGFSQGTWNVFQQREQQDTLEVIDWAARQRWSDGNIGMTGGSYSGINQIYAANKNPKHLKAIFPVVPGGDLVHSIVAPGGAVGIGFLPGWLTAINGTKLIPNVASMLNGTFDWTWLRDRARDPGTFYPLLIEALTNPSTTRLSPEVAAVVNPDSGIRRAYLDHADRIRVPTFIIGGWFDLFTYDELAMFSKMRLPAGQKQLVMSPTYHGTMGDTMGGAGQPPRVDVLQKAWFDKWLKGIDNGIDRFGPATLYQHGNGWSTATDFPRPGMSYQRMYLSAKRSGTAPSAARDGSLIHQPGSARRLTVAPGLSTLCSRDSAQALIGMTVPFPACTTDSRIAESGALTFTSAPVRKATVISGPTNVRLNAVHEATDGYWVATLNDVAPDGTSTQLTTGQTVASLAAYDPARSQFAPNGDVVDPYTYLSLAKRTRIIPGRPTAVDIGLLGTDLLLKPGHRLRIDVYAMNMAKGLPLRHLLNASKLRPQHIQLDPSRPSYVTVGSSQPLP